MLDHDTDIDALVEATAAQAAPIVEQTRETTFSDRWRALANLGVLRPTRESGTIGPVTAAVAQIEGIGRAGTPPGLCYALASQRFGIQAPLQGLLTDPQWASDRGIETGQTLLCHALTEAAGGSDPLSMTTRAIQNDDGGFVLTGTKSYITVAPVADLALVFARTDEGRHPFCLSAFLVDLSNEAVSRSTPVTKTALTDVPMGALEFHDLRLTHDALIGELGSGLAILSTTTTWERALLLSYALGPMHRVLEDAVEWSKTRHQFGREMGASPLVASRVSQMSLALMRSRRLVYSIAAQFDRGVPARSLATDAALTKLSISQDYIDFSQHAASLSGVRSFVTDSGSSAELIDPVAATVYAGPNDLLHISVARSLGLPVRN